MKYFLTTALLFFTTVSYSQQSEGSKSVVSHYDSTYNGQPLGHGSKKFIGNLRGKTEYNFPKLWNQLTPENSGKWEKVGITPDTIKWDWEPVTNLYKYAKSHKMAFKFHTLIWGRQQPQWISELSQEQQFNYISTWIRQVGQRFPDADMVDVVNEALPKHWPPDGRKETVNYINALGGNGKTGYDWVVR